MPKTDTRPRSGAPTRPLRRAARPPRLLVVGANEVLAARIARALADLRARVERTSWEAALDSLGEGDVLALVLVEPVARRVSLTAALRILRDHPGSEVVPLYAVVARPCSNQKARGLYRAGATAVFEWPLEKTILTLLLAETLGMAALRGPATEADTALTRTTRAHLRLRPDLPKVSVRCRGGVMTISGSVRTVAQRAAVLEAVAAVPGVVGINDDALSVEPARTTDARIERRVVSTIEATVEDVHGIRVSVDDGVVRVMVPARMGAEAYELKSILTRVRGIRELEVRFVRPRRARRQRASKLLKELKMLFPGQRPLSLSLFGGVIVLSGRVDTLALKRAMADALLKQPTVERVVNKLTVKKGR